MPPGFVRFVFLGGFLWVVCRLSRVSEGFLLFSKFFDESLDYSMLFSRVFQG